LIVVGGGAAGFFCAVNAARMEPGLKVVLVEKTNKLLSKVRISGGGRCNLTHSCFDISEMSRRYPRGQHFVKKSFHQFFTSDTIAWFEERGVKLKTETDGRMFPASESSQTIIDCLLKEVNRYGVEIMMQCEVRSIEKKSADGKDIFHLETSSGKILKAEYICIACGGYPRTAMFDWLKELGHSVEEPVPSLFTFNLPGHLITKLTGVSVPDAQVKIPGTKLAEEGPLLITHWGLSGPAILRTSAWGARVLHSMQYDFKTIINWLPAFNEQSLREEWNRFRFDLAGQFLHYKNPLDLPQRLWEFLLEASGIVTPTRWSDLPGKQQSQMIRNLCSYEVQVRGKTSFKEEFVTAGGISLSEIDANTMMSKKISNLFFAGEIMDVDGITGGYNFQHAWTSGYVAARAIAESSRR
jgi:predicted Rossmann fold flavoprotein